MWKTSPPWLNNALADLSADAVSRDVTPLFSCELSWWLANHATDADAQKLVSGKSAQELFIDIINIYKILCADPGDEAFMKDFLIQCTCKGDFRSRVGLYVCVSGSFPEAMEAVKKLLNCNVELLTTNLYRVTPKASRSKKATRKENQDEV